MITLLLLLACTGTPTPPAATDDPEPVEPAAPGRPFDVPEPDIGSDPCATAWAELSAFSTGLEAISGKPGKADADKFAAACARLPEPARPCMSNAYMLAHRTTCDELLETVPGDVQDALKDAMAGSSRKGRRVDGAKGSR